MSGMQPRRSALPTYRVAVIAADLDKLKSDGFITGWARQGRRWVVDAPGERYAYSQAQITAWLEGCSAMGANL